MSSVLAGRPPAATEAELYERYQFARKRMLFIRILLGVGVPLLLLVAWQVAAEAGLLDRRFFPPPTRIVATAISFIGGEEGRAALALHLGATLYRLLIGFMLGATCGVTVGTLMALTPVVRFSLSPLIFGLFPLPKVAIYPLVIIIFGLGDASSIALISLGVFFMTCINTCSGVLHIAPIYHDVASAFKMPPMKRWFRVFLPAAMPAIITGVRLGLGQALILVVSSEFISADIGIGRFIWDSWQILDIPRMFVGLACVLSLGACSALLGNVMERRLVPWINH